MLMRTPPENKKGYAKSSSDYYPAEALAKQFSAGDPEALAMLGSSPPSTSTGAVAVAEAAAAAAAAATAAAASAAASAAADAEGSAPSADDAAPSAAAEQEPTPEAAPTPRGAPPTAVSRFLPTTRRIVQFSAGAAAARPGDRVVYLDGAFDLFHPGHVAALRAARALGDFLLVGVHSDEDVRARRGVGRPIMDLHERALSVLACRFVNEVVIGAPAVLTEDLLTTFNVAVVARGTTTETTLAAPSPAPGGSSSSSDFAFSGANGRWWQGNNGGWSRGPSMTSLSAPPSRAPSPVPSGVLEALGAPASPRKGDGDGEKGDADADSSTAAAAANPSAPEAAAAAAAAVEVAAAACTSSSSADTALNGGNNNGSNNNSFFLSDERRYAVARAKGIFREFRSPSTLTAAAVVDRIVAHRAQFERRNAKKAAAEAAYYREAKTYVAEK